MCPKLKLTATALMSVLATASVLGSVSPAFAQTAPKSQATAPATAAPPVTAASKPTTPEMRAAADRLEPLARATFWAGEVNRNPHDAEAGVKLAQALRQLGRGSEAYDAAQQVLTFQPDNIDALLESARAAIAQGQGFFAIAPARKIEALKPKDWRAPTLLGIAYEQTTQPDLALAAHRRALALAPENAAVLCNIGMFYAAQGDRAQAEIFLRKAAGRPDATTQVRQDLALVLGLEGKLAESEALQRQDLPPQLAENNIAYLKAASSPAPAPTSEPLARAEPKDRNWNALAGAQAQNDIKPTVVN
jgi:Flp pilus assembly protein TadD